MRIWGKLAAAAVAPLMLTGCLWGPGKFTSNLALNKAGTFVLDYRGEIMLQKPEQEPTPVPWSDKKVRCYTDDEVDVIDATASEEDLAEADDQRGMKARTCTPAEIEREKTEFETAEAARVAAKRKENDEMAKVFGLPGSDDESNRRFAANLMKHQGWRSVTYKGKGLFDVDYHFEGRLNQDYAFPLMPESDLMVPFITIRPRTDGSVRVSAPAFTGGSGPLGARAKMMGLPDKGNDGPVSRAEGRFTITTDGEILTNNSEDGPVAAQGGRAVHWDVNSSSAKIPEMLVRF